METTDPTHFLSRIPASRSSFVSLNWDTSLESMLEEARPELFISYGSGISRARFADHGLIEEVRLENKTDNVHIAKMHGSNNWLYCDNCRRVYWFPPTDTLKVADQIVRQEEWDLIRPKRGTAKYWKCAYCSNVDLGTRIATFSYEKALDFTMFERSWALAERKLRNSQRWVFIGYSLPAADFEFKYLLKRVELACQKRPKLLVVSGGADITAQDRTLRNYQGLFGNLIKDGETFLRNGLTSGVIDRII